MSKLSFEIFPVKNHCAYVLWCRTWARQSPIWALEQTQIALLGKSWPFAQNLIRHISIEDHVAFESDMCAVGREDSPFTANLYAASRNETQQYLTPTSHLVPFSWHFIDLISSLNKKSGIPLWKLASSMVRGLLFLKLCLFVCFSFSVVMGFLWQGNPCGIEVPCNTGKVVGCG